MSDRRGGSERRISHFCGECQVGKEVFRHRDRNKEYDQRDGVGGGVGILMKRRSPYRLGKGVHINSSILFFFSD